jgi:hypothetical protein
MKSTKLEIAQRICFETFPSYTGDFEPLPSTIEDCLAVAKVYVRKWSGGPYFGQAVSAAFDIAQLLKK